MPAHIYARTGDHAGAARANLAGAEADRVYLKTAPADSFYGLAYYSHNLHFLTDSHMMQGRLADARQAAAELADRLTPHAQMMPMIESMIVTPMSVLLRFGRHDEVLKLPQPPADRPVMTAWWHFARGVALARTGKTRRGARGAHGAGAGASARYRSPRCSAAPVWKARGRSWRWRSWCSTHAWRGRGAHGTRPSGRGHGRSRPPTALPYDEPPVWFYPVRESLGAALLLAGNLRDAEGVFREDLERHPRNARSLFGLHESLVKQEQDADAAWVQRAFEEAWKNADGTLTLESL